MNNLDEFVRVPANARSLAYRKLVCGVGINDAPYQVHFKDKDGKQTMCPFYSTWKAMLKRCYDPKIHNKQPTYIDCPVAKEWHSFNTFRKWMITQNWRGNCLDKDILIPGNKLYSSDLCCFVDNALNSLLLDRGAARGQYKIGVCFNKKAKKFQAYCNKGHGKKIHLGLFNTENEAYKAYVKCKVNIIKQAANTQLEPIKTGLLLHTKILANTI